MKLEGSQAVRRLITPAKAVTGGINLTVRGQSGTVSLAGRDVLMGGRRDQRIFYLALDCNGDGRLAGGEWVRLPGRGGMSAQFELKTAGSPSCGVLLTDVRFAVGRSGVQAVKARATVNGCRSGGINGVPIRILDDDLDGVLTQDGRDAIAIGSSPAAMPLVRVHQIGGHHYELKVAADGAKVEWTRLAGDELGGLGVVKMPAGVNLAAAILSDGRRAYDLSVSGRSGIPAGDYKLVYGLLSRGGKAVVLHRPGGRQSGRLADSALTYPITAGKINVLRIGPPVRVEFSARCEGDKITVQPKLHFVGDGGELYSFQHAGRIGRPRVVLMNGTKQLSAASMEYG